MIPVMPDLGRNTEDDAGRRQQLRATAKKYTNRGRHCGLHRLATYKADQRRNTTLKHFVSLKSAADMTDKMLTQLYIALLLGLRGELVLSVVLSVVVSQIDLPACAMCCRRRPRCTGGRRDAFMEEMLYRFEVDREGDTSCSSSCPMW